MIAYDNSNEIVNEITKLEENLFLLNERKEFELAKYDKCKENILYSIALIEQKLKLLRKEYSTLYIKENPFVLDNEEDLINNYNGKKHSSGLVLIKQ